MFDSCLCVDPDETCTLLSRTRRKARKEHRCCECRQPILPGQEYEIDATVFEDHFDTYKTCITCVRIRESLFKCGWYYGGIWEDIHEAFCGEDEDGEYVCICPGAKNDPA